MTELEAALHALRDGWTDPVRDHVARIPPEHPDRPVGEALLAMVRYREGDWAGAEADAAALTTSAAPEARRWGWLVVALSRLVRGRDAQSAIGQLADLADDAAWRAQAALLSGDQALRSRDTTTPLEAIERAASLATEVADPAVRGWLRYDVLVQALRWWSPDRVRDVASEARSDFEAAGLAYGLSTLAVLDPVGSDLTPHLRVFTERGRTADAYRALLTRASRLHQAGDLAGADAGYAAAEPLAGPLLGKSLAPIRAVLALQRGRLEEVGHHLAAVTPPLLPAVAQAVAFARAAVADDPDPARALREAWLSHQGPPSPLGALAAGAAADRLEGRASAGSIARARAFALGAWPARDPDGRARLAARHARALDAGAPIPCGGFDLERRLGAGGMGEVWAASWAHADGLGGFVVKLVRAERVADDRALRSFQREIRVIAALSHPNIVPIVDLGATPGPELTGGRLEDPEDTFDSSID